MGAVKAIALLFGIVLIAFGGLFTGQGLGLIMWPASSFMLAQREWAVYGTIIMAVGAGLIWWSRRR